jgi:endonuclease I/chitodextrinase
LLKSSLQKHNKTFFREELSKVFRFLSLRLYFLFISLQHITMLNLKSNFMTKISLLGAVFLVTSIAFGQAPTGYYNTATGTGYTLKTQLYNIIKGHTDRGYSGLWTTYSTSDRDNQYENDNTIMDIYSENPTGADPYTFIYSTEQCGTYVNEGDCYNREHIIPQSVFGSSAPMVSDAHFIPPTDGKVNGIRSNYPHGKVATATYTSRNGGKLGSSAVSGYTGTVFEPIDAFKGDIARMYFYFATRYENTVAGYSYAMFNGTSNQVFSTAFLNMLLQWHANDPVSAREIARNNAIYARQGNRNPFIDNPNYVNLIWGGGSSSDTTPPSVPTSLTSPSKTSTSVALSWNASTDNVGVTGYEVYRSTTLVATVTTTSYTVTGLTANTTYSFSVRAKDAAGNASANSTALSVTTNAATATRTDLYLSEYVEGSSNNKALEIKNETGASKSLSGYSIRRQTNGSGSWSTGLALTGTIANGGKFVIVNSSISAVCYSTASANLSTSATEMTFNGNDAVGLFKNGVLIDVIGTFNGGTANFAADITLRRKSTATAPKATYSATDWDTFANDNCSGLGNRTAYNNLENPLNNFSVYPNPSKGNLTIDFFGVEKYNLEIYSVMGRKVHTQLDTDQKEYDFSHLPKGIYILRIGINDRFISKKIIIE